MFAHENDYDQLIATAIARWAPFYGVEIPAYVVKSLIAQESSFDTNAVRREPDGRISRGLMQVLEGTARDLGLRDPNQLHVPSVGIDYGVHYFAQKLKRYSGDLRAAIAAYNAGTAKPRGTGYLNQSYVDHVLAFGRYFVGQLRAAFPWAAAAVVFVAAYIVARRGRRGRS